MAKYKCIMCGYIFDEILEEKMFTFLDKCPSCNCSSSKLKPIKYENYPKKIKYYNAIEIDDENPAIDKIYDRCIDCGLCNATCKEKTGIIDICHGKNCIGCGKCVQACPVKALVPKSHVEIVKNNLNKKICIAYIAPSVRVTVGELFKLPKGTNVEGKLIKALRLMGFNYVLDTSCGADFTVIEEANELAKKIKYKEKLPMFSSCCPSWVKYVKNFYPEYLEYISSTKSPIQIEQTLIDEYFIKKIDVIKNETFSVSIVPCTSKKLENYYDDSYKADAVITVQELEELIKDNDIDFINLEDDKFDKLLGDSSSCGTNFGVSGGVTKAVINTLYRILTGNECNHDIEFKVSNYNENIYECNVDINGFKFKAAYVSGITNVKDILEQLKNNTIKYHFVEVMTCSGGCINGSGNPLMGAYPENKLKEERTIALNKVSNSRLIKDSYNNPDSIKVYKDMLETPGSTIAIDLLHNTGEKDYE